MAGKGRAVGYSPKPWKDALEKAAREVGHDKQRLLMNAARALVRAAVAGDITAAKELGDRLDGKAHQTSETHVTSERMVVRGPEPTKDVDEWTEKHIPKVH